MRAHNPLCLNASRSFPATADSFHNGLIKDYIKIHIFMHLATWQLTLRIDNTENSEELEQ